MSKEQAQYISEIRTTKSEKLRRLRLEGRGGGEKGNYSLSKKWLPLAFSDIPVSHMCCHYLKKQPAAAYEKETGRKPILATMAEESQIRFANWVRYGCNAFDATRPRSAPISFWTEQDVLRYVVENRIALPSVYGDIVEENGVLRTTGLPRTGCIACGFGVHREAHPNRFERLKITHPNQWNYVINKLGMGRALDFIGVSYGREDTDAKTE